MDEAEKNNLHIRLAEVFAVKRSFRADEIVKKCETDPLLAACFPLPIDLVTVEPRLAEALGDSAHHRLENAGTPASMHGVLWRLSDLEKK